MTATAQIETLDVAISRNVLVTIFVRAFYMITRFLIPPFVLGYIGLEKYGVWTALFVVTGYIGISVIGFSGAYVKFIAQFHAAQDYRAINELLSTGLAITIPLYSTVFAALWFGWETLFRWTGLPAAMEREAHHAAMLTIGSFLIGVAFWAFADLLNGLQRIATLQLILLATYTLETAFIVVLVSHGWGIQGLAAAFVARTALSVAAAGWYCFREFHWLRISPALVSRGAFESMFRFGGIVQVQSMLSIVLSTIERALAVPLLGPAAAGMFDLAKKLPASISDLTGSFFAALMPAASYTAAQADQGKPALRRLYLSGARYSAMLSALLCAIPVCFAAPLMIVWLGRPLENVTACAFIFGLAMQVHLLTGPGTSLLRGIGRLSGDFYYLVPNIAFLALLLPAARAWQGAWTPLGIALSVSLATALSALSVIAFAHATFEVPVKNYIRRVLAPCAIPYLAAAAISPILNLAAGNANRVQGAMALGAACTVYGVAAVGLTWRFVLDPSESQYIRGEMQRRWAGLSAAVPRLKKEAT